MIDISYFHFGFGERESGVREGGGNVDMIAKRLRSHILAGTKWVVTTLVPWCHLSYGKACHPPSFSNVVNRGLEFYIEEKRLLGTYF